MKIFLCSILILTSIIGSAQEHYLFSSIDSNDGLSENRVKGIMQLADGRMAIMTDGLVNLYDGTTFRYLHINDSQVYSLKGYFGYHKPYIEGNKYLWIKDYQRLLLFDIKKESFISSVDSILQTKGVVSPISNFFIDSEKRQWFLTQSHELIYKDSDDNKPVLFLSDLTKFIQRQDVLADLVSHKQQIFLFFKSGTMICFDLNGKQELYRQNPLQDLKEKDEYAETMYTVVHKQHIYLIYNNKSGICLRYDIVDKKWRTLLKEDYWFYTASVDEKENIWLSSDKGLCNINKDLEVPEFITKLQLKDGNTLQTSLFVQYFDNQGGLWLGTANRGLLYYHPNQFKFKSVEKSNFGLNKDTEFRVNCFMERDEDILIGTPLGIYQYSNITSKVSRFKALPQEMQCYRMLKDQKNRIWICAAEYGLYCIDGKNIQNYRFPSSVFYLYENPDGSLLLSIGTGFGYFNPGTGEYKQIDSVKNLKVIYQLDEYKDNRLIGLSDLGIFIYDRDNQKIELTQTYDKKRPEIFLQNNFRYDCVYSDSRGLIWLGTRDGLSIWNPTENKLKVFHTEDGLINNRIQSIIEDKSGYIWISTSGGISRVEVGANNGSYTYSFSNFNRYDGVLPNEFFERAVYRTSSGSLLWGGVDGFNEIDPSKIDKTAKLLSPPLFTKFFLFGNEIKQGRMYNNKVLLEQSITSTKELTLSYNQNFIGFEFSALNYVNPTQTYYRFKLEGVDQEWQEISATDGVGQVNYTNLHPGEYTLKVSAANNNKQWGDSFASIKIQITPPFWKTTLAFILYIVLFILFFYLLTSFYLRRKKEKIIRQQKDDLDRMKYRFYTNISHELRTPLTLIITPLDSLIRKIEKGSIKQQLIGIYRNANDLLGMVNQLLDFRKLEMTDETLKLSFCNINEFLLDVFTSFSNGVNSKNINFNFESSLNDISIYIDKNKLKRIINNLLSNAYKFTPVQGNITLVVSLQNISDNKTESILIQIKDTGSGIAPKDLDRIFDRFYQANSQDDQNTGSGIGLHLAQEYTLLHNGSIEVESKINEGSIFSIHIPTNLFPDHYERDNEITENERRFQILIIEDNVEFLNFLHGQLSEQYRITTAINGNDGLQKTLSEHPDLIISDIMMPEMNGIELCEKIKNNVQTSHIPVILLTARSSDEAQIAGYGSGADAYISKPFNMDILQLRIQHLIEQQKKRKELFKKAIIIQPGSVTSTDVDEELIKNALAYIEKNIDNPLYSVDQFSKDMKMDRTGLYRKLVAIVGQSPIVFIRSVRLKRAAQLLSQNYTVSEVADMVGFGTVSYFSKCFQEEYGMKPSQYTKKE